MLLAIGFGGRSPALIEGLRDSDVWGLRLRFRGFDTVLAIRDGGLKVGGVSHHGLSRWRFQRFLSRVCLGHRFSRIVIALGLFRQDSCDGHGLMIIFIANMFQFLLWVCLCSLLLGVGRIQFIGLRGKPWQPKDV